MAATYPLSLPASRTFRPGLCTTVLFSGDLIAVGLSLAVAATIRFALGGEYSPSFYLRLMPLSILFALVYGLFGLYPGIINSAVTEIRKLSLATTVVFVLLGTLMFLFRTGVYYSRAVFFIAWLMALFAVPLTRALARAIFGRSDWWGYPVFVIGPSALTERVVDDMRRHPEAGLRPVASYEAEALEELDNSHGGSWLAQSAKLHGVERAVLALPEAGREDILRFLESEDSVFSRVYLVPGIGGLSSFGVETRDLGDSLSLEVRQDLALSRYQLAKRLVDQSLSLFVLLTLSPVLALVAAAIRLDSRGSVFHRQTRLGLGGKQFRIWKFRTMHRDAARMLDEHLAACPEAREEWEANQKLKNDPRITRVGRILRKTSLDELPQLVNVLMGDMSLVGPRPIVHNEVSKYGRHFSMYTRVLPGLTGLWQVSGRSDVGYGRRVELDTYYVRNWSPWLDVYLLARTVPVVIKGSGAC
ncbi:undecaprenyl-phosphate galactose phosphotransferase WbaP [Paludibaculum fermentans]|uniref:Undecaprenyl-phosphate galactose phosphotransferase WbaP n=1 Tax=Paludibaculum fermentans TaxID=1473598 RepID=A0A7S7NW31_PALFE|nr:undecaprenyl-phosphate galactose phosphotransferase WbaP [Paludibaculum fermentans]QOY90875.1 undecaprenyl-phosphate galactose phosphotransferase WbaP [Paludibaculum fermentans]